MYNKSILIGRMVADPELRTTPNGVSVCSFRIAVNRPYSKDGGKADFIDIVVHERASLFAVLLKSKPILVEGSIQNPQLRGQERQQAHGGGSGSDNVRFVGAR